MKLFENNEYLARLNVIIDKWDGACFKMNANNPYREIDCGRLVGRVFRELDIFFRLDFPQYTPNCWYVHCDRELLKTPLEHHLNNCMREKYTYKKYKDVELYNGDIVLVKGVKSKAYNHLGIYNSEMVFSADVGGVKYRKVNGYLDKLIYRVYSCPQQR